MYDTTRFDNFLTVSLPDYPDSVNVNDIIKLLEEFPHTAHGAIACADPEVLSSLVIVFNDKSGTVFLGDRRDLSLPVNCYMLPPNLMAAFEIILHKLTELEGQHHAMTTLLEDPNHFFNAVKGAVEILEAEGLHVDDLLVTETPKIH